MTFYLFIAQAVKLEISNQNIVTEVSQ